MNMDKFLEQVKDLLQAAFPEAEVDLKNVTKNNGLILHGVCIREDERTISPTIYLDSFYEELDDVYDGKIEYVVKKVIDLYEDKKDVQISTGFFTDYEQVRHMLGIKLINKDKNEELLKSSPHYVYGDLAAVFIVWDIVSFDFTAYFISLKLSFCNLPYRISLWNLYIRFL